MIILDRVKVEGAKKDKKVFLYTLSTCGWCKKTKQFLIDKEVEYEYIDVDKCDRKEQQEIVKELREKGVKAAFPVIMIDEDTVITWYKEKAIQEALNK